MSRIASIAGRFAACTARFPSDERGHVALLFGISILPIAGLVGAALDYNRATQFRSFMLRETDAAALAIASADTPNTDKVLDDVRVRLVNYYGTGSTSVTGVGITTDWVGGAVVTVTTTASLATTVSGVMPGFGQNIGMTVKSSVKRKPAEWQWSLPTIKDLSYEAGDYNRISVYCYDETKKAETGKGRRLETLTAISDNGGTDYSKATLPSCGVGETLSYKLWNVRNSRTTLANWQDKDGKSPETTASLRKNTEYYSYYTDTTIDPNTRIMKNVVTGGKETISSSTITLTLTDLTNAPILETIVCLTGIDCKNRSQGGILPNNNQTGRTPAVASTGCADNKSVYFGWEDRPPTSAGSSDKDYDDIRIVVTCPTLVKIADKEIRIVK